MFDFLLGKKCLGLDVEYPCKERISAGELCPRHERAEEKVKEDKWNQQFSRHECCYCGTNWVAASRVWGYSNSYDKPNTHHHTVLEPGWWANQWPLEYGEVGPTEFCDRCGPNGKGLIKEARAELKLSQCKLQKALKKKAREEKEILRDFDLEETKIKKTVASAEARVEKTKRRLARGNIQKKK